ncbi:hypothetical protein TNCV_4584951 [Trichonephila clavipes]|nr:hypothetical protein TNCV_4584951 [Trichonephila clavipes]
MAGVSWVRVSGVTENIMPPPSKSGFRPQTGSYVLGTTQALLPTPRCVGVRYATGSSFGATEKPPFRGADAR